MSAEPDLLPCPFCGDGEHLRVEHLQGTIIHPAYRVRCDNCGACIEYTDKDCYAAWNARANVAHATAARDAEVEALRAKVGHMTAGMNAALDKVIEHRNARHDAEARAERLAEALRGLLDVGDKFTGDSNEDAATWVAANDAARAALEQESNDA